MQEEEVVREWGSKGLERRQGKKKRPCRAIRNTKMILVPCDARAAGVTTAG